MTETFGMDDWSRFLAIFGAGAVALGAMFLVAGNFYGPKPRPEDEKYWLMLMSWLMVWGGALCLVASAVLAVVS
jgi:hypothetical protein